MKTLYLCRHAKSSWADLGMDDHERPLNERGMRNAPHMAHVFKQRGEPLDLLMSSTAKRALSTARFFADALSKPKNEIVQDRSIYLAERSTLVQAVNRLSSSVDRVMLFGHNPGFTTLLDYLSDAGVDNLPTCGLVRIDFAVDNWTHIGKNSGTLVWFDYPKRYPGQD